MAGKQKLDDIEAYVARGRRFASSETETLKSDWVETYRSIVSLAERERTGRRTTDPEHARTSANPVDGEIRSGRS